MLPSSRIPQLCTAWVIVTVTEPIFCEPPLFMGFRFSTPCDSSQWQVSQMATTTRERFRAMDVIEMPVSDQNVSSRENLWSGRYFGLPSAQGSRTITSPEGNLN